MEELKQLRDLLNAHYNFYEYEEPKDLTIVLSMDQVDNITCALNMILPKEE